MKEIRSIVEAICSVSVWRFRAKLYFGNCGKETWMMKPLRILGAKDAHVGDHVTILTNLRLEIWKKNIFQTEPVISIGNGVNIEQNVHITAAEHVYIGDNVSICGGVIITDIIHPYEDIHVAPGKQSMRARAVNIGNDSFIGMYAMIMPGVTVGQHCVIGVNSVVTHDVPDYTVVGGAPAHIIKRYSFEQQRWVNANGHENDLKF